MTSTIILPSPIVGSGLIPPFSEDSNLSFFKNFCEEIKSRLWKVKKPKFRLYETEDFLKVFFFSEISGISIRNASETLNKYYVRKRRGRIKIFSDGRKRRVIPHQTDVNKFLRRINLGRARNILRACLDNQLKEALQMNLISNKVDILIDFTEHAYYGKREDKMIKGTNRQKGTKKMRHYLAFSIFSRNTHLFAGLRQVATGQSKIPIIIKFIEHLLDIGFQLGFVIMDREFYRAEILDEVKGMGGNVLIPAKNYKKISALKEEYLKGIGRRIRKYTLSSAAEAKLRYFQNVFLVFNAKKEFSLLDIKRQFQQGKLSLKEASKNVYAIMTTKKPKGKESSWACRNSRYYKKRWHIEAGFRDLNKFGPRWRSKHDNVRYLDMLARMLLYNSWKANRALLKKCKKKIFTSRDWTQIENQNLLAWQFLEIEKKLIWR
jgi:hypothetical protein